MSDFLYNVYSLEQKETTRLHEYAWRRIQAVIPSHTSSFEYGEVCQHLGGIYQIKENNILSMKYYNKALLIFDAIIGTNSISKASLYNEMAFATANLLEYDVALEYFQKSLAANIKGYSNENSFEIRGFW